MKSTINTFDGGLSSDTHPLLQDNKTMIDAMNATMVTRNGNESVIQNDMGNAKIEDALTGNVMGLNPGFIPLGMKEHQGVLYIASYNQETGEGELGSIPSPKIQWVDGVDDCNQKVLVGYDSNYQKNIKSVDSDQPNMDSVELRVAEGYTKICDTILHPGDQFMLRLKFEIKNQEGATPLDSNAQNFPETEIEEWSIDNNGNLQLEVVSYPLISRPGSLPGWYTLKLYSVLESGQIYDLSEYVANKAQEYYVVDRVGKQVSPYWWIDEDSDVEIDTAKSMRTNCYLKYPNILPGQLCVRLEYNSPKSIEMFQNGTTSRMSPYTYTVKRK